jgi:hypothetical protein
VALGRVALPAEDDICALTRDRKPAFASGRSAPTASSSAWSEHVGIGSDFDGGQGAECAPAELDSVVDLPKIGTALAERGFSETDIANVMGQNWIRPGQLPVQRLPRAGEQPAVNTGKAGITRGKSGSIRFQSSLLTMARAVRDLRGFSLVGGIFAD